MKKPFFWVGYLVSLYLGVWMRFIFHPVYSDGPAFQSQIIGWELPDVKIYKVVLFILTAVPVVIQALYWASNRRTDNDKAIDLERTRLLTRQQELINEREEMNYREERDKRAHESEQRYYMDAYGKFSLTREEVEKGKRKE